LRAGGPVHGWDPEMHVYASEAELIARTEAAVKHLLDAGHAPADIVVLSWQGVGRSVLMRQDRLAGLTVSRATGSFDEQGQAVYTQGELRIETVHRFKGQSADCVVIAGIEFERWTDEVRRRLFVAMTRARIRLALVVGPLAEQRVLERLADSSPATP
jgi:superfamily I DNA/RNA helicase